VQNGEGETLKALALAAVIPLAPVVACAACPRETVASRDGWAQVREQPGLSGKPLWRIWNGIVIAFCGDVRKDKHGHPWHYVWYRTNENPPHQHSGWVAAGLLAETSAPAEPAPAVPPVPAPAPPPPQPAPAPIEQHTTNNFNVTVEGELPFDPSACVTTTTLVHRFPVYERPDADSTLVAALEVGDSVCVLSTGEWTHVHFKRGKAFEGWVHGLEIQGTARPY
jgi:hypothetical protein